MPRNFHLSFSAIQRKDYGKPDSFNKYLYFPFGNVNDSPMVEALGGGDGDWYGIVSDRKTRTVTIQFIGKSKKEAMEWRKRMLLDDAEEGRSQVRGGN